MVKSDREKYENKKLYIIYNNHNERVQLGKGKNMYLSIGHIRTMMKKKLKNEKFTFEMTKNIFPDEMSEVDNYINEFLKNYNGFKIVEYKLVSTGKEIDLNKFIKDIENV
jgi:ferritin